MKAPVPSESAVLRAGLDYLTLCGWQVARSNTGAVTAVNSRGRKRFIRYGRKGDADLSGWSPWGIHVAAEAKRPDGSNKLSPEQVRHLRRVRFADGIAIVFGSLDEIIAAIELAWLEALARFPIIYLAGKGCSDRLLRMSFDQRRERIRLLTRLRVESEARYLPKGELQL